jgi:hypothetical protein
MGYQSTQFPNLAEFISDGVTRGLIGNSVNSYFFPASSSHFFNCASFSPILASSPLGTG